MFFFSFTQQNFQHILIYLPYVASKRLVGQVRQQQTLATGPGGRIKMRKNISQGVSAGVPSCQCHWFEYDRARNKRLLTTELLRSGSILNHISLSGLCKLNFKSRDDSTLGPLLFSFGLYSSLPCISTHKNASVQKPCWLPKYQQPVYQ